MAFILIFNEIYFDYTQRTTFKKNKYEYKVDREKGWQCQRKDSESELKEINYMK